MKSLCPSWFHYQYSEFLNFLVLPCTIDIVSEISNFSDCDIKSKPAKYIVITNILEYMKLTITWWVKSFLLDGTKTWKAKFTGNIYTHMSQMWNWTIHGTSSTLISIKYHTNFNIKVGYKIAQKRNKKVSMEWTFKYAYLHLVS